MATSSSSTSPSVAPPPTSAVKDGKVWTNIANAVFEIGEVRLQAASPEERERFRVSSSSASAAASASAGPSNDGQQQEPVPFQTVLMKEMVKGAAVRTIQRAPGNGDALKLSDGSWAFPEDMSPGMRPFAQCLIKAQEQIDEHRAGGNLPPDASAFLDRAIEGFMSNTMFRAKIVEVKEVLIEMYCPPPPLTMKEVWQSFFNRTFDAAERAIAEKTLKPSDLEEREPFLYLGLIATTALDFILRSMTSVGGGGSSTSDGKGEVKFRLALGNREVTVDTAPPESRDMVRAFVAAKHLINEASLSNDQLHVLKLRMLHVDDPEFTLPPENVSMPPSTGRIIGLIQGVAVQVSQFAEFKQHFEDVIGLLCAMHCGGA